MLMTPFRSALSRLAFSCVVAFGAGAVAASSAMAATVTAHLDGASEVPPLMNDAGGDMEGMLDTKTGVFTWKITYTGLSGMATAGHFHGPAMPGVNAGVVLPFKGNLVSPVVGTATLTPEQVTALEDGKWYVNLHTAAHPGGEIRGQLKVGP